MGKNYLYTDLKKRKFTPIFREITDLYLPYKIINATEFTIYQTLMRFLCRDRNSHHYGYCYISNTALPEMTGISKPTVIKCLKKLAEVGLIEIQPNPYGKNDQQKRYIIFEPLEAEEFFRVFKVEKKERKKVAEGQEENKDNEEVAVDEEIKEEEEEKEEKPKKGKKNKEEKPKKAKKKSSSNIPYTEKAVEEWTYPNFIEFFKAKFFESYGTEMRLPSSDYVKESSKLKQFAETYLKGDKIALKVYIEECFKRKDDFKKPKNPTLGIGFICSISNSFDIAKIKRKATILRQDSANNLKVVENISNNEENMLKCDNKEEKENIINKLDDKAKESFNTLQSIFG